MIDEVTRTTQRGELWEPCQGMTDASIMVSKVISSPSVYTLLYLRHSINKTLAKM